MSAPGSDTRTATMALQARNTLQQHYSSLSKPLNYVSEFGVTAQKMVVSFLKK